MSALIRATLSSPAAQLHPGEWADLTLTIQNFGEVVDRYQITVEGVDPAWVTLSRSEISLFPKDQDQARLTIRPPAGAEARAGHYDVRIHITSLETPTERTTVAFDLEIAGQAGLDLTLTPPRQSGATAGLFELYVGNPGNTDLTVFLSATDVEGRCFYTFDPAQLAVPAGQSRTARLSVRPIAAMPGKGPQVVPFTVLAQPAEAPHLARQVEGQWEQRRRHFPPWPVWLAGVLGAFLVLGGVAAALILVVLPRLQLPAAPVATTVPAGPGDTLPPAVPTTALPGAPTLPTATPTPQPSVAPSPTPTPDLAAEMRLAIERLNTVRAEAESTLDPELMRKVAVDPYLTTKMRRIQANKDEGSHWETPYVEFTITTLTQLEANKVEVWVTKTETKLYYPKGSALPDDELCSGTIYSYRNCTYKVRYILVRQEGQWYVSIAEDHGECESKCQH